MKIPAKISGTIISVSPWSFTDDKTKELRQGQTIELGYQEWQKVSVSCPTGTFSDADIGSEVEFVAEFPVPDVSFGKETKLKFLSAT
jgi:hypothetical protein